MTQQERRNKFEEICREKDSRLIKYRCDFKKNVEKNSKVKNLLEKYGVKYTICDPDSQYTGAVYWYKLEIINRENVKKEYSDIWGFHIMPYCITEEDVKNAKPMIKSAKGNDMFCNRPGAVDYDSYSGNFHKWPDPDKPRYQVVLIPINKKTGGKAQGPGYKGSKEETVKSNKNMYFPPIMSTNDYKKELDVKEDIEIWLEKALNTVLKKL